MCIHKPHGSLGFFLAGVPTALDLVPEYHMVASASLFLGLAPA